MEKAEKFMKFLDLFVSIFQGDLTEIPEFIDFPHGVVMCKVARGFIKQAEEHIPRWNELKEWFIESEIQSYDADAL